MALFIDLKILAIFLKEKICINLMRYKEYCPVLVRIGLSIVFLWFGINQLLFTENFSGYVPEFMKGFFEPSFIIISNGIFETIFGVLLLMGIFTRFVAFLLGLHLVGIIIGLGYNEIAVRDFGLMLAIFSVALNGPDKLCLYKKF